MLRLLLLDLDEVLIQQRAYHQALKECVERVGRWCGFPAVRLTDEDIALFESMGVTSEWDSSAICAALLLDRAWSVNADCTLPDSPAAPDGHLHDLPVPDFQAFVHTTLERGVSGMEARQRIERRLVHEGDYTPAQREVLQTILRYAYDEERSLTNRIIQELTLGSEVFASCYGRPAAIPGPGFLRTMDSPLVSPQTAAQLVEWSVTPERQAVVFTARPSRLPDGTGGTPETEIGLDRLGLSALPFISMGHLDWLCGQRGLMPQSLLKPSPVHALAALRLAVGDSVRQALAAAAQLELDELDDGGWHMLDEAQVFVFEDSFRGLLSARGAQGTLDRIGVRLSLDPRGVTRHEAKRRSLESAGGVVYPDFASAARDVLADGA